jgi:hypothetical protein
VLAGDLLLPRVPVYGEGFIVLPPPVAVIGDGSFQLTVQEEARFYAHASSRKEGVARSKPGRPYWNRMEGIRPESEQPGWPAVGVIAAYAAAIAAFGYALVSLYWAAGGRALLGTVGGYVEQLTHRGGALPVIAALTVVLAKVAGGLLALALVRPWGRVVPRRWLLAGSAAVSLLLVAYGGVNVFAGALVLSGVIHPAGSVDRAALRWHVGLWDLWFLAWGIFLALAVIGYRRRAPAAS